MTRTALSVVIVTYNSGASIRRCLASLWPQLRPGDEVFLVDNASTDGGAAGLESGFPGLRVIANLRNRGFGAACNQALAIAKGQYDLLLNPDTELATGALDVAVRHMEQHPNASVLGAKILLDDGRMDPAAHRSFKTVDTYFIKTLGLGRLFPDRRRFGRYYLSYADLDDVTEVDSVVGAFLLIRRSVVDAIGMLDERFFMYCEDEDWCWRAKRAGGTVVYHPGVVVRHQKGGSARQAPLRTLYHWHRSLYLYHRKNMAAGYPALVNAAVYSGILAVLTAKLVVYAGKRALRPSARKQTLPQSHDGTSRPRAIGSPKSSSSYTE